jgi:biotin carboxyl carrier protein
MRYYATVAGQERTIELEPLGGSQYRLTLDGGTPQLVDAERVEGQTLSLLVNGRSYDVDFQSDGEALETTLGESSFRFELLDERRRRMHEASSKSQIVGPAVVKAPMPGKIVKVLVGLGQDVVEGQGVVIIEAMKMENELRAPKSGKVREVKVREGQTVEGRAELLAID